jgi:hypothetical protein
MRGFTVVVSRLIVRESVSILMGQVFHTELPRIQSSADDAHSKADTGPRSATQTSLTILPIEAREMYCSAHTVQLCLALCCAALCCCAQYLVMSDKEGGPRFSCLLYLHFILSQSGSEPLPVLCCYCIYLCLRLVQLDETSLVILFSVTVTLQDERNRTRYVYVKRS